jgi:hypothetical protein
MVSSLFSAILHAFWHDLWTNATHDDRDYTIARMLSWQFYMSPSNAPFGGKNLYALLVFGRLHHLLCSLPWKQPGAHAPSWLRHFDPLAPPPDGILERYPAHKLLQDVRGYMEGLCDDIFTRMSSQQRQAYRKFYKEVRTFYAAEFEAREQYNINSANEQL